MAYKQVFFDLDHTLWDFETNSKEALEDLFNEFSLHERGIPDFSEFHQHYVVHNNKMWERLRKGFISREELHRKRMWLTLLDFKIGDEDLVNKMGEYYLQVLPTKTHLFPDTLQVLDYLEKKDYPMHLVTNGAAETQIKKITCSGIDHYFDKIITSETAGYLKPRREIFDFALHEARCNREDVLMVGDSLEIDIAGAQNAGIDQVYYNSVKPTDGIQPTFYIASLSELKEIL